MEKKTPFPFFHLLPLLLSLCGLMAVSAACKKKDASMIYYPPIPQPVSDTTVTGTKKYLALGDSYTIGTSVTEKDRYPVQTAALLKAQGVDIAPVDIIATNGWTTADLINGISGSQLPNNYDAVTLLIGVNNQYQGRSIDEYRQQLAQLVQRAVQFAKNNPAHVFVISIPDYSVTPFARGGDVNKIATEIDMFNDANKAIAANYRVNYLYITDESRKAANDPSLIASDSLHFSGKEYSIWSAKLAPMIKTILP